MTKILIQSIRVTVVMTALTGIAYPLAVTGLAQTLFRDKANGSQIPKDGKMVGSELLAQPFTGAKYFEHDPMFESLPVFRAAGDQRHFQVPREQLAPDDDFFQKLGINSLQALELLTRLENHFGIELPDYELQGVADFRTLAEKIQARL